MVSLEVAVVNHLSASADINDEASTWVAGLGHGEVRHMPTLRLASRASGGSRVAAADTRSGGHPTHNAPTWPGWGFNPLDNRSLYEFSPSHCSWSQ